MARERQQNDSLANGQAGLGDRALPHLWLGKGKVRFTAVKFARAEGEGRGRAVGVDSEAARTRAAREQHGQQRAASSGAGDRGLAADNNVMAAVIVRGVVVSALLL